MPATSAGMTGPGRIVTFNETNLTMVPLYVTSGESSRPKGRRPGDAGRQGRGRCPRARPHQPYSRAVRASCLPALRPACEVRRWKWVGQPVHETWPGSHQGTTHPLGRAEVERRQASAPDSGRRGASRSFRGAPRTRLVRVVRPAFAGVPLPFLFAGSESQRVAPQQLVVARSGLVPSPTPSSQAGEGKQNTLFDIARGRGARARTGSLASAPAKRGRGTALRSRVVEGASEMELRCRGRNIVAACAPPTALRAVPPPRWRGAG